MNQLKEKILKNGISACMVIFVILLLVHCGEAIFLRLDESIFAENFIIELPRRVDYGDSQTKKKYIYLEIFTAPSSRRFLILC